MRGKADRRKKNHTKDRNQPHRRWQGQDISEAKEEDTKESATLNGRTQGMSHRGLDGWQPGGGSAG